MYRYSVGGIGIYIIYTVTTYSYYIKQGVRIISWWVRGGTLKYLHFKDITTAVISFNLLI